MSKKKIIAACLAAFLAGGAAAVGGVCYLAGFRAESLGDLARFLGARRFIESRYVGDVDDGKLMDGAISGMVQALDGFWAASEPWTSRVTLLLSPAAEKDAQQAIAAIDSVPLTRVRATSTNATRIQVTLETALDRIPLRHAIEAALEGIATVESQL